MCLPSVYLMPSHMTRYPRPSPLHQRIQRCPQSQVWNRGKLVRRPSHSVFVAWHVPRKPMNLLLIATTDHGATELALLVMFFRLPHCCTEVHTYKCRPYMYFQVCKVQKCPISQANCMPPRKQIGVSHTFKACATGRHTGLT